MSAYAESMTVKDLNESGGIETRDSLLSRLKKWDDDESWRQFFDTYWLLIFNTAGKAGLQQCEAEDVVQETMICVRKNLQRFRRMENGSFKGWLLQLTRRRISDHFRRRARDFRSIHSYELYEASTDETSLIEGFPDPAGVELENIWEAEWNESLLRAALERTRSEVGLKHYQIFDLYRLQECKVKQIATMMKVSAPQVYLVTHRVQKVFAKHLTAISADPTLGVTSL